MKYLLAFEFFDFERPPVVMSVSDDFPLRDIFACVTDFDCEFRRCVVYNLSTLELECVITF